MAKSSPQQSINQQVNLQVKGAFVQIQAELEIVVKQKILELRAKLLDPAFIFEKLSSFLCDPKVQEKIHNTFEKILNFLEKKLLNPVGDVRDFIQKIMDRILKIKDQILEKINSVLQKLQQLVSPLSKILRIAPIALNALSGIAAQGGLIDTLGRAITAANNFISDIFSLIGNVGKIIKKYVQKAFKFVGIIGQALAMVTQLYDQIDKLIQYAKFLLLAYEGFCLLEDQGGGSEPEGCPCSDGTIAPSCCEEETEQVVVTLSPEDIFNKVDTGTNIPDLLTSAYQQLLEQYAESGQELKAERFFKMKDTYVSGTPVSSTDIERLTHYRVKLITHYNEN